MEEAYICNNTVKNDINYSKIFLKFKKFVIGLQEKRDPQCLKNPGNGCVESVHLNAQNIERESATSTTLVLLFLFSYLLIKR